MTCNCSPSTNLSCISQNAASIYTVSQPTCVLLPDDSSQPNPYFDTVNNFSYWAYKLIIECDSGAGVSDVYIPIYGTIDSSSLIVFERILSCGRFETVPYDFEPPSGATPPEGFRFLHISNDNRYTAGSSVYYRLQIVGDFPPASEDILLQTANSGLLTFSAEFLVPGEPEAPNLTVSKNSNVVILNNEATIEYAVTITNTGNVDLSDINYLDIINFDGTNITLGAIEVTPPDINVDTSVPGTIRLSANIGTLAMGESFNILYTVPIVTFNTPNTYVFNSTTQASSGEVLTSINTTAQIEVVQFATGSACNVTSSDTASFVLSVTSIPSSPESLVTIESIINIPAGVTVRFTDFGNCTAVFLDNLEPVIPNTDISNRSILITCMSDVPPSSTMNYPILLQVVSTNSFDLNPVIITSSLENVMLQNPADQVSLGAAPLPNTASLGVNGSALCSNPCEETPA